MATPPTASANTQRFRTSIAVFRSPEHSSYDRLRNVKSFRRCGSAFRRSRAHAPPRDAMDRQACVTHYHGCSIVELYNEHRPHDALGHLTPSEYVKAGQKRSAEAADFYLRPVDKRDRRQFSGRSVESR